MKLIAHRGIHHDNVHENTLTSITKALEDDRFSGVEFDVRVTKDRELVIFHDAYYNDKLIRNTNYCDLPKYVPRLQDVLKINSNKIFLIEIKYLDDSLEEFMKLLNKYESKKIYVTSFKNNLIDKISKKKRSFKVGILNYIFNSSDISHLDFLCIIDSLIDDEVYEYLKKHDKEIFSYGILNYDKIGTYDIFYIVDELDIGKLS